MTTSRAGLVRVIINSEIAKMVFGVIFTVDNDGPTDGEVCVMIVQVITLKK